MQCLSAKQSIDKFIIHENVGKIKRSIAQKRIEKLASKEISLSHLDINLKMPSLGNTIPFKIEPRSRVAENTNQSAQIKNLGCYKKADFYLKSL
jgi:protoporphyrinogen oxidase